MECRDCARWEGRRREVGLEAPSVVDLLIVGESPGEVEDREGRPFVGPAGILLDKILGAAGIRRAEIGLGNVLRCAGGPAEAEEVTTCTKRWLEPQVLAMKPRIIVSLGLVATRYFVSEAGTMTTLRGTWKSWRGVPLLPMFHPAFLLRNDNRETSGPKALTWKDIREVKRALEALPERGEHPWEGGWPTETVEEKPAEDVVNEVVVEESGQVRLFGG